MKKVRKKYGINGYAEYSIPIPVGRATKEVLFSGGTENAYGSKPATFSTHDSILQHAIERSKEFRSGLISIIDVFEIDVPEVSQVSGGVLEIVGDTRDNEDEDRGGEEVYSDGVAGGENVRGEAEETLIKEIEVDSVVDAKALLNTDYGIPMSRMKNKEGVIEAASSVGIKLIFK